jgi:hypothetical protein
MGSSSAHDAEYVEQLEFVYNHTITRPELTLSEYRQFHRPRLPLAVVTPACPWQFQTRVITQSKNSRGITTAADGSTMIGSYHSMMSSGSKAQTKIKNEVRSRLLVCNRFYCCETKLNLTLPFPPVRLIFHPQQVTWSLWNTVRKDLHYS